ncbi:hypothetical protein [Shimia thalassica]|uniref:hypothetical protein n=1 Tax=Shimia thalassica TaxID=1715693 RepID=UPI0027354491|nr:hypothetical protein [Shimia thalassica]MDP2520145.1 hypothetical protein [Shimia thalassica]
MAYQRPTHEMVKSMAAGPPEPPKDLAKIFRKSTFTAFSEYLTARPFDKWTVPELRQLCQVCLLEDQIFDVLSELNKSGPITTGAQAQVLANPAIGALTKLQAQQGAILRRLGIAILGVTAAGQAKQMAKDAQTLSSQTSDKRGLLA